MVFSPNNDNPFGRIAALRLQRQSLLSSAGDPHGHFDWDRFQHDLAHDQVMDQAPDDFEPDYDFDDNADEEESGTDWIDELYWDVGGSE